MIDISRTIEPESVVYPGDDPLVLKTLCEVSSDCPCRITQLGWTTHFLTHVDPPSHFVEGGKTLDQVPLTRFYGPAVVVEVDGDSIRAEHVPSRSVAQGKNILFKTRNSTVSSRTAFDKQHVFVTREAAEVLARHGVNMVGIDYISIDKFGDDTYPAHRTLLGNDVLILEGLDLSSVQPGEYILSALPLKIASGDGSPVRAVLEAV
jgi:arylformamidase